MGNVLGGIADWVQSEGLGREGENVGLPAVLMSGPLYPAAGKCSSFTWGFIDRGTWRQANRRPWCSVTTVHGARAWTSHERIGPGSAQTVESRYFDDDMS